MVIATNLGPDYSHYNPSVRYQAIVAVITNYPLAFYL